MKKPWGALGRPSLNEYLENKVVVAAEVAVVVVVVRASAGGGMHVLVGEEGGGGGGGGGGGKLELIQSHMAQKPVLRGEVGCACVAREVSVERGGMGERGCARRLGGKGKRWG